MNYLAIDTSMQACSVAVLTGVNPNDRSAQTHLSACYEEIERGHAERLMAMIDEVLEKAGTTLRQIDQFAVCRGPGTFTGVRIGIATARGLALACKKPLMGLGTLQVLAARVLFEQQDHDTPGENKVPNDLGIAVDARRGEIYWQLFDMTGKPHDEPIAYTPQHVATLIKERGKTVLLAGSGANLVARFLDKDVDRFICTHPYLQPDAARLAEEIARMKSGDISPQERISPLYLRPADAKIQTGYAIERQ